MADLYINGIAMSSLNWWLEASPDVGAMVVGRWQRTPLHRRRGVAVTGVGAFSERRLTLRGAMITSANTVQARVTAEDTLRDLLGTGLLMVQVDDDATPKRVIDAYLDGDPVFERVAHPMLGVKSNVTVPLLCPDGDWRAVAGSAVAMPTANTRYAIPLGTAPSAPVVRVMGSATGPQVIIRSTSGSVVVQVTFSTLTLGANDWLDIDCQRGTIEKVVSGTRSSAIGTLNAADAPHFPFNLDPAWGDYTNSQWPTAEVSTTGGAEILYTKRYR